MSTSIALRFLSRRMRQLLLLVLGTLAIGVGFVLLVATSVTTQATVDKTLAQHWRTSYDLLVRPASTVSEVERAHGLVQANHLSNTFGGITQEQYEAVCSVSGVEVAAPVAMIGYTDLQGPWLSFPDLPNGFYRVQISTTVSDGLREHSYRQFAYLCIDSARVSRVYARGIYDRTLPLYPGLPEVLLAGIDPEAEARLVGLDQAVASGDYLTTLVQPPQRLKRTVDLYPELRLVPMLLNTDPYVEVTRTVSVHVLDTPDDLTFEQALQEGGSRFLHGLPVSDLVLHRVIAPGDLLDLEVPPRLEVTVRGRGSGATLGSLPLSPGRLDQPYRGLSPIQYRVAAPPPAAEGALALEAIPVGKQEEELAFRSPLPAAYKPPLHAYHVVGTFDIERLAAGGDALSDVPLETYSPPMVLLRYDAQGRPLQPPVTMQPTFNEAGYILAPPLGLTTLQWAQFLSGREDCISAIRVRVQGVDRLSEQAQALIEQVAAEIVDKTGLHVDVTVGSSPRRVLVHIPGYEDVPPLGWVEEPWVQKGVSISIHRGVSKANLVLFGVMLAVCGLYILTTTLLATLSRTREIGILRAVGWRATSVLGRILGEALLQAALAGVLALLLSLGAIALFHLQVPPQRALLILPIGLALYLAGSLYPALQAAGTPPLAAIQAGELHLDAAPTWGRLTLWSYGARNAWRRRRRTLLSLAGLAISAGLVVLFLLITASVNGLLYGTLLGEHISLRIRGYHFALAGICFAVSALTVAEVMLLSVAERRREIGRLAAIGWRSRAIGLVFLSEAAALGLAGGLVGSLVGLACFARLYRSLPPAAGWAVPLAISLAVLVTAAAALYPARLAARVPPAEAVRHE